VYREPGAGQTIASTGGFGRNTTHFFGAGLVEMLGEQVTQTILLEFDDNRNGILDRAEVRTSRPVRIRPVSGGDAIDFGDLSPGADGVPRLNPVFRLWYVDAAGRVLSDAISLDDPGVSGYGLAMQPFGWGRGRVAIGDRTIAQGGEASTLREFFTVAADFHMGLEAHDPSQQGADPAAAGFGGPAGVSLNGARQYDFGGSIDPGRRLTPGGVSLDDPDGDGHVSELTEGDIDAVEFYLLHLPAPAVRATPGGERGRRLLTEIGCTTCHVENWDIRARDTASGWPGDRRLFRFDVQPAAGSGALTGRLIRTVEPGSPPRDARPAGRAFTVERIYTDFKHWDLGPAFHERRFDASLQREHRTAPLWGVGSTAPYGHSGRFPDLRRVILAHGGAAGDARARFAALPDADRDRILEYLEALVLYQSSEIPGDIDGDGHSSPDFRIGRQTVGYERFNPEFLFQEPLRYRQLGSYTDPNGRTLPTLLIQNIEDAFGLTLPFRVDRNGDGFPDAFGPIDVTEE
jgi:hypothetical protein